jgi:hypothetical protein
MARFCAFRRGKHVIMVGPEHCQLRLNRGEYGS